MKEDEMVEFRTSPIHGLGAFARVDLPAGTRVIEYRGEKITREESARRCAKNNTFIFELDDEWHLDGAVGWNPARFINHSCDPNCEASPENGRIWIKTLRMITTGEELGYNYGYDLEAYEQYPCRCGAKGCVGFIVAEEFFEDVRRSS